MRDAAANLDDDFAIEEPVRKKAARRLPSAKTTGKRNKKGKSRFRFGLGTHSIVRYGAIGLSGAVAIGILVNALVMQKSRHPAPLFGASIFLGQGATAARSTPKAPQAPKVDADDVAPTPVAKPRAASRNDTDTGAPADDAIGRLLQGGQVPGVEHPDTRTVLGVQRALAKLGFAVKATGTYGPQTKKALERFEKDHHLPINDELTRRVVKILAAESGLKIER